MNIDSTNSITFIENPPFVVNFNQFISDTDQQQPLTITQRVRQSASRTFALIIIFTKALCQSGFETVKYSWASFKIVVLGYYSLRNFRPSVELSLTLFKIALWILGNSFVFIKTTGRLFLEKAYPNASNALLKYYADKEINCSHIRSNELALDASAVPPEITIDSLLTIYRAINFDNAEAPGYMNTSTRGNEADLITFIRRVTQREPFIGTPAGYDTARLMAFYQQIEDAIRISLHELAKREAEFISTNGNDLSTYDQRQRNEYQNILEDKARIAIDLAIAGAHCGARYMGEAMTIYASIKGGNTSTDATLEENLIEILAHKRKEIAQAQIQTHLGADTHVFANYMASLGKTLGIPGTQNVIEQLSSTLDTDHYLQLFFQKYSVKTIIKTIKEKIASSQNLREKVIDWFRDRCQDWKPWSEENYQQLVTTLSTEIRKILEGNNASSSSSSSSSAPSNQSPATNFVNMITTLKASTFAFPPMTNKWSDYIEELFADQNVKTWCKDNLPNPSGKPEWLVELIQRNKFKEDVKGLTNEQIVHLKAFISGETSLNISLFSDTSQHLNDQKISSLRKLFENLKLNLPPEETLQRIVSGQLAVDEAVRNILQSHSEGVFAEALKLETLQTDGLSPEMLEWLLVSQNILVPQIQNAPDVSSEITLCDDLPESSIAYSNDVLPGQPQANPTKLRYQFPPFGNTVNHEYTRQFNTLLEQADSATLSNIIQKSEERCDPSSRPFYPYWKSVRKITIPKVLGKITSNFIIKSAFAAGTLAAAIILGKRAYKTIPHYFTAKCLPFFINNTPLKAIQIGNKVVDQAMIVHTFVKKNRFNLLLGMWATRSVILRLPEIPYVTPFARAVDVWGIFCAITAAPATFFRTIISPAYQSAIFVWDSCNVVSRFFNRIASENEAEKLNICKQKCLAVWLKNLEILQPTQALTVT